MTDAARTRVKFISPSVAVAVHTDSEVAIHTYEDGWVVYEPAQLRELRKVLGQLADERSIATSLGENCLDEEGYIEWDGSIVYLFDAYPSYGIALTKEEAIELEKTLFEFGH